jgi:tetratricopeptide (TPR) repeat protein
MKSLKPFPTLLFLAIPFTHAVSQESRPALLRSLSPGAVSIEGRRIDPRTGRTARAEIVGSGFFVDEQGRVVTCYHVIDGLKEIFVRTKSGRRFNARLIKKQRDAGLALLSLTPLSKQRLPRLMVTSTIPEIGAELLVIGSLRGSPGTASNGIMSGVKNISKNDPDLDYAGQILQMTNPISSRSSGGPVIGLNGLVVGVAVARADMEFGRAQNINYAIPGHRALNFLLPYYREIAAKTPSDSASYYNLGRIHDALNQYSEAESAYRKSLRLKTSADACRALGVLFLTRPVSPDGRSKNAQRREYIEKAIRYLNYAIAISPDDGKARYNLAVAYFEINEKDQARLQCGVLSNLRGKQKLTQPVLGNAARLCSWSNAQFKY